MSRIDDLIAERCPGGVPFGELGKLVHRGTKIKWSDAGDEEFRYIDLTSVDRVTHAISDTETIARESAPSRAQQLVREGDVLFGTTRPMLKRYCIVPAEFHGQIASTGYCVFRPDTSCLLTNFLFHVLGTAEFYAFVEANERGASYPAIPDSVVKEFQIPVPPLEVQREIVGILDNFTALEAALEAELEARRRQYVFYRDSLFSDGDASTSWSMLGDVASVRTGQAPPPGVVAEVGPYAFINAGTSESGRASEANTAGDAVTIPSRGQGGVGIVGYQTEQFWCGPLCYRITSTSDRLRTRYLYFYLKSVQPSIRGLQQAGGTPALNKKELVLVRVPMPRIEEQDRIVSLLDKFDSIVNDLSIGLPAELAARRKQYEYYRNRLLTFEEALA